MCVGIRFNAADGSMYFGRNYDWNTSYGEQPWATPAGFPIAWRHMEPSTSRHDIIGMAIAVGGFPMYFEAASDAGLAVAGLSFPKLSCYADEPLPGKRNVTTFEFPLWITSQFDTLAEVREALENTVITSTPFSDQLPISPVHWLIGDATGSLVAEYTERGMEIFENEFDVVTNNPGFSWHRDNMANYALATATRSEDVVWGAADEQRFLYGLGLRGFPGDYSSASRFAKAAYLNTHYPVQESELDNVARMFHTLDAVAVPLGASERPGGDWTQTLYQGLYSQKTNTYYYRRYTDLAVTSVCLSDVDFGGALAAVPL